jgi:hypothetical protein
LLILLLAAVLRGLGLDVGQGQLLRPDEQNVAEVILQHLMLPVGQGVWWPQSPAFFEYPSLYLYLLLPLYWLKFAVGWLFGQWSTVYQAWESYQHAPQGWYVLGRWVSALASWATIPLAMLWAKAVWRHPAVVTWVGILLAVAYLPVREAHFGVTDSLATALLTACLALTAWVWRHRFGWQLTTLQQGLWLACACAGLAAGTKYPAGLVLLYPLAGLALLPQATMPRRWLLLGGAVAALATFLLTSPFITMDFATFWRDFSFQVAHMAGGHGLDVGRGWLRHPTFTLWHGLGGVALLAAVAGLVHPLWRGQGMRTVLAVMGLVFFAWAGSTQTVFVRYMLPLLPWLCGWAVVGVMAISHWVRRTTGQAKLAKGLTLALLLAMVVPNFLNSATFLTLWLTPDTRQQAATWLAEQGVQRYGAGVLFSSVAPAPTFAPQAKASTQRWYLNVQHAEPTLGAQHGLRVEAPQGYQHAPRQGWQGWHNLSSYQWAKPLCQADVTHVITASTPLGLYATPTSEVEALAKQPKVFQPVATWHGTGNQLGLTPHTVSSQYDAIDAFYIPYALNWRWLLPPWPRFTPGPTLTAYALACQGWQSWPDPPPPPPPPAPQPPQPQFQPPQELSSQGVPMPIPQQHALPNQPPSATPTPNVVLSPQALPPEATQGMQSIVIPDDLTELEGKVPPHVLEAIKAHRQQQPPPPNGGG